MAGRGRQQDQSDRGQKRSGGGRGSVPYSSKQAYRPAPTLETISARERGDANRSHTQRFQPAPMPETSAWGARSNDQRQRFEIAPVPTTSAWGSDGTTFSNGGRDRGRPYWKNSESSSREGRDRGRDRGRASWKNSAFSSGADRGATYLHQTGEQPMECEEERRSERSEEERGSERREELRVHRRDQSRGQRENQRNEQLVDSQKRSREQDKSLSRGNVADRGLMRGHDTITKILQTKPDTSSKQGKTGKIVHLETNYFRIIKKPTWHLHLYHVNISPEIQSRKFQAGLLYDQMKTYGKFLFDGTMMYLNGKLEKEVTEFATKGKKDDQPYVITIKLVGLVSSDTHQYLHSWSLLFRQCEKTLGLQLMGRNYYDPIAMIDIPNFHLQLWPGYINAIRQHERDVLVCVEIGTKVMRTDTLLHVLEQCYRSNYGDYKIAFDNRVLGSVVLTTYNNKTYKITGVDYEETPESDFHLKDGTTVTYIEYYKRKYDINIKNRNQPLLISRSSEREERAGQAKFFALVPELCCLTGFDEDMRKNQKLMREVSKFTRVDPENRVKRLMAFNKRLREENGSKKIFSEWNFQLDTNLVQLQGRCLPNESIIFGGGRTVEGANWSEAFHKNSMYVSIHLHNWALIYPPGVYEHRYVEDFVSTFQRAGHGMTYEISAPHYFQASSNHIWGYINVLKKATHTDPQLFVCVVPSQRSDLYGAIKKWCCSNGKPSQVLVLNTIKKKGLMSICTKVAIQVNTKLGGIPWMIKTNMRQLMVIGFDVCHDILDREKKRSYGAMVATMYMQNGAEQSTKYFSAVSPHVSGNELSNNLEINIIKAIREFGIKPNNILMYRDGVGEGQITYVKKIEIDNILKRLREVYENERVRMTFIVVTKKSNTRFFLKNRGQTINPLPGTIVDDVVTFPERHDFWLTSQLVAQGTVSPTNYNILHNEMGKSADVLQRMTYKMTHLYYNWAGTLAVPAVCQYAHKLAYMAGNFLPEVPTNDLQKQLYFL